MEFKDYYTVLGIAPDANDQTVKQAYRKLAHQQHPDVNLGDKQAEARFKEINEAYQALSDPERRRKYDAMREQDQRWRQRDSASDFNWGQWQATPNQEVYTYNVTPEDLEDLFGDTSPYSDFFRSIFGQSDTRRTARPRRGRDAEVMVEITARVDADWVELSKE